MKQKIANMMSLVDDSFVSEADPTMYKKKKKLSWKKLTTIAACICIFSALTLGILIPTLSKISNTPKSIVSQELISISENAQYLPSRDLLVANQTSTYSLATASITNNSPYSGVTPMLLLKGGLTEDEYEALIEDISPIDTPFNREFTVLDAKNEVTKILSTGVLFDKWFTYAEGELSGTGKYYVSNKNGKLTVTRLSGFQPWIYDAQSNRFLDNDDFNFEKRNFPIHSDSFLKISIYTENGKEVVECEVVDNLSYFDNVTPISYQFIRNVKDTSFTKIQIVARNYILDPKNTGDWGYDINTDLPYGYRRAFTQLDYSSPDNIKWLNATQYLPYAFDLTSNYTVQYGCRSAKGGFYYSNTSHFNMGHFSYKPSDAYRSLKADEIIKLVSQARAVNMNSWYEKSYYDNKSVSSNDNNFTAENQRLINEQITSVLGSLKALTKDIIIPTDNESFDCTSNDTTFEKLINEYLDLAAKVSIDRSDLAKNYLNNDLNELSAIKIMPIDSVAKVKQ